MKILILSCDTGEGHNSAGKAIKEAAEHKGHSVTMGQPEPILDSDLICHCNGAGAEKPDPAGGCHSGGTSDWASAEAFCRAL